MHEIKIIYIIWNAENDGISLSYSPEINPANVRWICLQCVSCSVRANKVAVCSHYSFLLRLKLWFRYFYSKGWFSFAFD